MAEHEENRGSGVSIDDPYRLAATHPILGVASQKMLISHVYGEQNKDWFDNEHKYIQMRSTSRRSVSRQQIRRVFFDESALDYSIPLPRLPRRFQRACGQSLRPGHPTYIALPIHRGKGDGAR